MRVFISGIMQGSTKSNGIQSQDYRSRIVAILHNWDPEVEAIDPLLIWPDSVSYSTDKAKETLLEAVRLAGETDVLVAYLPTASMGTALEMWSAYQAGVPVYTITGMRYNWAILTMSTNIFPTIAEFEAFVRSGGLTHHADAD